MESKKQSWIHHFISNLKSSASIKQLWDKTRRINLKPNSNVNINSYLQPHNNNLLIKPKEIANSLAQTFCNNFSNCNYTSEFQSYKFSLTNTIPQIFSNDTELNNYPINTPIQTSEVKEHLAKGEDFAPGPDGIHNLLGIFIFNS